MVPSTALIVSLAVNRFPNQVAPNAPNKIPRNPTLWSLASFSIVSLTSFVKKPNS